LWRGEALVLGEPKRPWPFFQPQPKRRRRRTFLYWIAAQKPILPFVTSTWWFCKAGAQSSGRLSA
jgi:hypothetical protein